MMKELLLLPLLLLPDANFNKMKFSRSVFLTTRLQTVQRQYS